MFRYILTLVVACSLFAPSHLTAQTLCFYPANDTRYETLSLCNVVAVTDFDNDGHLDVCATTNGSEVSYHRGNGDGTFDPAEALGTTSGQQMVWIDIDGDNDEDLARVSDSGELTVELNNGSGILSTPINSSAPALSSSFMELAALDYNNDGDIDFVINDYTQDMLHIFKGNGSGSFSVILSLNTLDKPGNIATGDLNNDGKEDVVCNYNELEDVTVFYSNGDDTFDAVEYYAGTPAGATIGAIEIAEFTGDNYNDILVGGMTVLNVLKNNGNETFSSLADVGMGSYAYGVVYEDWDNDGDNDPSWANGSTGGITIVLNNGNGSTAFLGNAFYSANAFTFELASGDFNEDGNLDIITANGYPGNFTFMEGHGDGRFGPLSLLTSYGAVGLGVADFDLDGDLDVIGSSSNFSELSMSRNLGDGSFSETEYFDLTPYSSEQLSVGDFNEDGYPDVVTHGAGLFVVSINDAIDGFEPVQVYTSTVSLGGGERTMSVGYFNGDDHLDLAGTYINTDELAIVFGNGDGTFGLPLQLSTADYPRRMVSGDLNQDGWDDLVVCASEADVVQVFFSNGNGTFQSPINLTSGNNPNGATILDANLDGKMDAAIGYVDSDEIVIFLGNNGSFGTGISTTAPTGSNVSGLNKVDMNNDGKVDIVAALYQTNQASIFFSNGDGTFQPAISFGADRSPVSIESGDFNEDGAIDLAVLNSTSNNISVILNNSAFISVEGSLAFCEGDSVHLVASEGYSYEWNDALGTTTQDIYIFQPGNYNCAITNQSGTCTLVTAQVSVEVYNTENVTLDLDSSIVCVEYDPFVLFGGYPFGGDYSGTGVNNNFFDPGNAGVGEFAITYHYEDAAGCTSVSLLDTITVVLCNDITESEVHSFNVFPTQTSDFVTVNGDWMESLMLFDMSGHVVFSESVFASNKQMDLTNLASGIYMLQIHGANATTLTKIQKL
jgi:adhesin/invasin